MKTAKFVQSDIIALLEGSDLAASLSGSVYRGTAEDSYRPRDSKLEDIVVIFTAGTVAEVQEGVVTVQIYVPDITPYDNGVFVEDGRRTAEIEEAAASWVESLSYNRCDYLFNLTKAIHTSYNVDIHQHFVVVSLGYKIYEVYKP